MERSLRDAWETKRTFVDNSSRNAPTKLAGLHSGPRTRKPKKPGLEKLSRGLFGGSLLLKGLSDKFPTLIIDLEMQLEKIQSAATSEFVTLESKYDRGPSLELNSKQLKVRVVSEIKRTNSFSQSVLIFYIIRCWT